MNQVAYLTLLIVLFWIPNPLNAQDACAELFIIGHENTELEYTILDKKGKAVSTMYSKVILVEETRVGTIFHFESRLTDVNSPNDPIIETYAMRCHNDTLFISMKSMLPSGTLESYRNMQIEISGNDLPYPRSVKESETLPNAAIQVEVSSGGMRMMSIKATTSERKVESKETITTSAGDFDCFKITETTEVKVGFITTKTKTNSWFAPGVGLVKQETFDKKGRLSNRKELQKILN
jgi:hypothetical protein